MLYAYTQSKDSNVYPECYSVKYTNERVKSVRPTFPKEPHSQ